MNRTPPVNTIEVILTATNLKHLIENAASKLVDAKLKQSLSLSKFARFLSTEEQELRRVETHLV